MSRDSQASLGVGLGAHDQPRQALCISGIHPAECKTAKGIVIPKPGKPGDQQVRSHRVIDLLDSLGKLLEKTAAHPTAD